MLLLVDLPLESLDLLREVLYAFLDQLPQLSVAHDYVGAEEVDLLVAGEFEEAWELLRGGHDSGLDLPQAVLIALRDVVDDGHFLEVVLAPVIQDLLQARFCKTIMLYQ